MTQEEIVEQLENDIFLHIADVFYTVEKSPFLHDDDDNNSEFTLTFHDYSIVLFKYRFMYGEHSKLFVYNSAIEDYEPCPSLNDWVKDWFVTSYLFFNRRVKEVSNLISYRLSTTQERIKLLEEAGKTIYEQPIADVVGLKNEYAYMHEELNHWWL